MVRGRRLKRFTGFCFMKNRACSVVVLMLATLSGCSTIPVGERAEIRQQVNDRTDDTISALVAQKPELRESVDSSVGYFVGRLSGVKVPIIGVGSGLGVLYDKEAGTRTYLNVKRYDFGVGLGASSYRLVVLFQDRELMETFRAGTWQSRLGAESVSSTQSTAVGTPVDRGASVHMISESGAVVTMTARVVKLSVNTDLTDTGVSEVSIPGTGFTEVDVQGADAPRIWDRRLPFMAQKVIDLGYDLPLPYGIGITYADVNQDMFLGALQVGINGGAKESFDWVSFENASADSESVQLKLDAWLFPFMNVFGLVGKVRGKAPLDVLIDGNGMLDQLGIDCSTPPPNPQCAILQDKNFKLSIQAPFSGNTYGIGTVLAGGWNNWFVAIPFNVTYADMDTTDTDGLAITVTPRFGRVINLGGAGNLALYAGGNYLNAELTVTGTVSDPGNNFVVDYTIEQKNADEWNLLLGGNWDINKRWSWSAEYNGFIGSREAFISSITLRF